MESPTTLSELSGSYSWETPARGLPRTIEVAAEGQVQRATLKHLHTGDVVQVWLESPLALGGWDGQVRAVRNAIRQHLDGGDRKQALKQTADLGALVPLLRPASVLTLHSSQGSSFDQIWLHNDLNWCTGPEISPLSYVGISRARTEVHLMAMPRGSS